MKTDQTQAIIVYGHPFCGAVSPVRQFLRNARAAHKYVDITLNPQARRHVAEINDGNLSVPTLVFPDNSTLTEPTIKMLESKLRLLGYQTGSAAHTSASLWGALRSPTVFFTLMTAIYLIFSYIGTL